MNEEDEAFEDLAKRQGDWGMQGSRKHQILRYAENVESKGTSMTPQQIELALETIALVLEDLKKTQEKQQATITTLEEALKEHAMRKVQRLGQEIEQEPVAWQWLGSAHFRKKLPKNADITEWNPLYTTPPQENT